MKTIKPVLIPGKAWDVQLPDGTMLCEGRGRRYALSRLTYGE